MTHFKDIKILLKNTRQYPIVRNGRVYSTFIDGTIRCFNTENGFEVWQRQLNVNFINENDGYIFLSEDFIFTNINQSLFVLNQNDGKIINQFKFDELEIIPSSSVENMLLTTAYNEKEDCFQSILLNEKNIINSIRLNDYVSHTLIIQKIGIIIEAAKQIKCVDILRDEILWDFLIDEEYQTWDGLTRPRLVQSTWIYDDCLIIGLEGYKVIAINLTTGVLMWHQSVETMFTQNLTLNKDLLYLLDSNYLQVLNPKNGLIIKSYNVKENMQQNKGMMIGHIAIDEEFIYCTTFAGKGNFLRLDKNTGKIGEKIEIGEKIPLNARLFLENDKLYLTDVKGNFYQLS